MDDETGFINFGRRFYDPSQLRWISLDPLLISEGTNRYNYLENNPFRYVDPDGRLAFFIPLLAWGAKVAATYTVTQLVVASATAAVVAGGCAYVADKYEFRIPTFDTMRYQFQYKWANCSPSSHSKRACDRYPLINLDCGEIRLSNVYTGEQVPTANADDVNRTCDMGNVLNKRSTHCDPNPEAEGSPHTVIEKPGPDGKYTTFNGDGTFKQYRGSGKEHGGIPRPNIKENGINESPIGPKPGRPTVRPARPNEIPGYII